MIDHRRIAAVVLVVGLGVLVVPLSLQAYAERAAYPPAFTVGVIGLLVVATGLAVAGRETASARVLLGTSIGAVALVPLVVRDPGAGPPWVLGVYPSAAAASCLVSRRRAPALLTVAFLVVAVVVTEAQPVFATGLRQLAADVVFGLAVAAAAHAILATMRAAEDAVQAAHDEAVSEYATARAAEASVRAAVQWDAYLHDEVLAALAAVGAGSDAEARTTAAEMLAGLEALGHGDVPAPGLASGAMEATLGIVPAAVTVFDIAPRADDSIPSEVRSAVIEALTEALRNVRRHAFGAGPVGKVVVSLDVREDAVRAVIRDDGVGFVLRDTAASRFGLPISIHGRMEGVGGAAAVRSWPGAGTEVELTWPA